MGENKIPYSKTRSKSSETLSKKKLKEIKIKESHSNKNLQKAEKSKSPEKKDKKTENLLKSNTFSQFSHVKSRYEYLNEFKKKQKFNEKFNKINSIEVCVNYTPVEFKSTNFGDKS